MSRLVRRASALLVATLALGACRDDVAAPPGPPYIAIVARVEGRDTAPAFTYRVREASGTLPVDRTLRGGPADTLVLSVQPASYEVTLDGVPPTCAVRDGGRQFIVVPENTNTTVVRWSITCRPALTIATGTDGLMPDSQYVWSLVNAGGGTVRAGTIGATATVAIADVPPGDYLVALDLVDDGCTVTSDGGDRARVTVGAAGGAAATFRVRCSDPARRPALPQLAASAHDGVVAWVARARDPDGDLDSYEWTITDCARRALDGRPPRLRRGLDGDTLAFVAAAFTTLADSVLRRGCLALRVADRDGNTTPFVEVPLVARGAAPVVTVRGSYLGTSGLRAAVAATDAEGDIVGTFGFARLRDGIVGAPDGLPDLAVYNARGYPGVGLPDITFGARPRWDDVLGVVAIVVDARGGFGIATDDDLFR